MRQVVGWARELLAGNGIILDYDIARFVADAEAIHSYEGTREINTLKSQACASACRLPLVVMTDRLEIQLDFG
ncbi:hypothetical protein OHA25_36185 [Nonomuraea sp. NBC_00507]|uniref:acyl-CoA dehydrogenase family protein n=1 Tax=Nonomuraea sp. NBC_00507 TaxID=2976002 RepID=UPI002E17C140